MTQDHAPALPFEIETVRDRVVFGERVLLIDRPATAHSCLVGENLPYWAELWPASRILAQAILHEQWTPGMDALEIGCGLGLPGIAALALGLRVTFSDYDPEALRFAAANARLNGFTDFQSLQLDWRNPPQSLRAPVLLGSDLTYELASVAPLIAFINQVLVPGGMCLLADLDRLPARALREALSDSRLSLETQTMRTTDADGRRQKGTLYRIHKGQTKQ